MLINILEMLSLRVGNIAVRWLSQVEAPDVMLAKQSPFDFAQGTHGYNRKVS